MLCHSFRNLPQARQGAPNDTVRADDGFSAAPTALGSSSESISRPLPGFPVDLGGFGALHAPFFMERRTRGLVQRCVAGNPGPGLAPMAIFAVSLLPQLAAGRLDKGGTDWYWFSVDGVPPDFRFAIDRQVEERMEDKTAEPEQSLKVAT
jgi:hypothetical protein